MDNQNATTAVINISSETKDVSTKESSDINPNAGNYNFRRSMKPFRGSYQSFYKNNPVLQDGEFAIIYDLAQTGEPKYSNGAIILGDGKRSFRDLPLLIRNNDNEINLINKTIIQMQCREDKLNKKVNILTFSTVLLSIATIASYIIQFI